MNEQRLTDIETRIAFQEDVLDTLNKLVYQQQQKLDRLEALCASLSGQVQTLVEAGNAGKPGHEKPPHY